MPAQFPCLSFTGTQSRTAWRAQQQTPQQDTGIRESNSKTGLEHVILHTNHRHKVFSVTWVWHYSQMSNLSYSPCLSKLTGCKSTKAHPPSLRAKEEQAFSSPKPCMGTQSLFRWEAQRQTTRDRQKEVQGLDMPHTSSPIS